MTVEQRRQIVREHVEQAEQEDAVGVPRLPQRRSGDTLVKLEGRGLVAAGDAFQQDAAGFHQAQRGQPVQDGKRLLPDDAIQNKVAVLSGRIGQSAQVVLHDLAQDARGLQPLVVRVAQPVERCHLAGDRVHAVGLLKLPGEFLGQQVACGTHEGLQPAASAVVEGHGRINPSASRRTRQMPSPFEVLGVVRSAR